MWLVIVIFLCFLSSCDTKTYNYKISNDILLEGASFASEDRNNWFNYLCEDLSVNGYNKAISGTSIKHTAQRLYDGTLYTLSELDNFGIFMLMHVHNENVYDEADLKTSLNDYNFPAEDLSYSQAYDYVLRKYREDCYNLKYNKKSRWYGSNYGKPCIIVCLTHWHDSRVIFNDSIRLLQGKHNFYLCEIDKTIGFSKTQLDKENHIQPSIQYSQDSEIINGIEYGWHMKHQEIADTSRCFIQNKVSSIVKFLVEYIYEHDSHYLTNFDDDM